MFGLNVLRLLKVVFLLWIVAVLLIFRRYLKQKHITSDVPLIDNVNEKVWKSKFNVWAVIPDHHENSEVKSRIIMNHDEQPGGNGNPVLLQPGLRNFIKYKVLRGWVDHAFNAYVSDLIPVNRSLLDVRDDWCKSRNYSNALPKASVVICFHNEANSTLLRTLYSVLDRSPDHLLKEVILVDDASTMFHLKSPLEKLLTSIPKVRLIQTDRREGLIRARMIGIQHVVTPVAVFLDSHCECTKGWLKPLLERIALDPTTIASPVVDLIHDTTFEYVSQETIDLKIGGFSWGMKFKWIAVPSNVLSKRSIDAAPIKTPTISGGLFAINVKFFKKLGFYDEGFDIWGAENLELSFKAWMCGGSLEIVPCSHVGHVFRKRFPYGNQKGSAKRNAVRLAEVWMDDYAKYFYERIGYNKGSFGDVSTRKELRVKLKCKSFKWYLDNVYPEMLIPDRYVASGQIKTMNYDRMCLDAISTLQNDKNVNLVPCHNRGGNQFWVYTKEGQIQNEGLCLDYQFRRIFIYPCVPQTASQIWHYNAKTREIINKQMKHCLTAENRETQYWISLMHCVKAYSQKWIMTNFSPKRLVRNYLKNATLYKIENFQ